MTEQSSQTSKMANRFSTYFNRQASGKDFLQIVGIQTTNPNQCSVWSTVASAVLAMGDSSLDLDLALEVDLALDLALEVDR